MEAEAQVMALRVELMVRLREHLSGMTQGEAAKLLGVTQPRVPALLKGVWKDFGIDTMRNGPPLAPA